MNNQTPEAPQRNTRQYLTIALVLLFLTMGISMIYKSCSPKTNVNTIVGDVDSENIVSEFENHPEDQTLNDIIDAQDEDLDAEESIAEEPNVIGEDEVIEEAEPAKTIGFKKKGVSTTHAPISNPERSVLSKYMVIAGSFSTIENARKSLEHTILSGFENSEIVKFNDSKFYTVCAVRSDDEQTARAAVARLKTKKIDAFLHVTRLKK